MLSCFGLKSTKALISASVPPKAGQIERKRAYLDLTAKNSNADLGVN